MKWKEVGMRCKENEEESVNEKKVFRRRFLASKAAAGIEKLQRVGL